MRLSAIAAQVMWIGQPSGTVSSTISVMNRADQRGKARGEAEHQQDRQDDLPQPERKAMTAGAGNGVGSAGQVQHELVGEQITAVSLSCKKPSHLRMPDFQNGTAKRKAHHELDDGGLRCRPDRDAWPCPREMRPAEPSTIAALFRWSSSSSISKIDCRESAGFDHPADARRDVE